MNLPSDKLASRPALSIDEDGKTLCGDLGDSISNFSYDPRRAEQRVRFEARERCG